MIFSAGRSQLDRQPSLTKIRLVPTASVMLASLMPAMPMIATTPLMPPVALMLFLAWRLLQREIWYPWAGVALGLFYDLSVKQPPGSAMMLWTVAQSLIALFDQRALWRDYWQDWIISALLIAAVLSAQLVIANWTGGHTRWIVIVPQIIIAILLQPLVMRFCGYLDQWRFR